MAGVSTWKTVGDVYDIGLRDATVRLSPVLANLTPTFKRLYVDIHVLFEPQ